MNEEGKIGFKEAMWLMVIAITAKVYFTSPSSIAKLVGTAGWYMTLFSAAAAAFFFTIVYFLLKRYPGKNIMEVYDSALGEFIGSFFSIILAVILLITAAINMREFAEVLKVYVFPDTPPTFIMGLCTATAVILSFIGLEGIARYAKLIVYFLIASLAILMALAYKFYEIRCIYPLDGYGFANTLYNGFVRSSAYGEVIITAIIAKSLHGTKALKKIGYTSIAVSGIIISATLLASSLVFSYYFNREIVASVYEMALLIDIGIVFHGIEPLFLFFWNISTLISISIVFYSVLQIYTHIFEIDDKRAVALPFGVILLTVSIIPQSIVEVSEVFLLNLRRYSWFLFYLPPVLAFTIAILRKKKGDVRHV